MPIRDAAPALLADAIEMLREADRLHRQFFTFAFGAGGPCWTPPADIVENERTLVIRVALPGVAADAISVATDGRSLHVSAVRSLAAGARDTIHMLEIPYGRFERRIDLPAGRYEIDGRDLADGCLVLHLRRLA
jgi:HSP20 family molecular chaperone IbpA